MFEEPHVRHLHMGDHAPPSCKAAGPHRESDELTAEVVRAVTGEHGEAVAFPLLALIVERVEAHGAARLAVDETKRMQRPVIVIALIPVVLSEQSLFGDEDRSPQTEVGGKLVAGSRQHAPAGHTFKRG
jgi:hypothetical protein